MKRIIKSSPKREQIAREKAAKIKEAMGRKPSSSGRGRGVTVEQLAQITQNQAEKNSHKVVRGNKQKRFKNARPQKAVLAPKREAFQHPTFHILSTPEWFESKEKEIDVSIIVPMYKSKDVIEEQIKEWHHDETGLKVEIIYVDDCCPMHSYQSVLQSWSKKSDLKKNPIGKIVINHKNGGFGCSCNIGARHAVGKYLLFLNADCVVTPNWIRPMYDLIEKENNVGIVGNMQVKPNGSVDSVGSQWSWRHGSFLHVGRSIHNGKFLGKPFTASDMPKDLKKPRDVEMVTGACFMISRKLFNTLNGFDLAYRVGYWEDSDLNMRVQASGYRVMCTPESKVYHKVSHSNAGHHPYIEDNRRLFFKQWVDSGVMQAFLNKLPRKNFEVDDKKIVVYTAITNSYDGLKEQPPMVREGVDFVAFLDNNSTSKTWDVRKCHDAYKDPNRNAKIHKILPHKFFPDKEYSLWIDGSVYIDFAFPISRLIQIYLAEHDMAIFKHPDRNCIYAEAAACMARRNDDPKIIKKQIQKYTQEGYPPNAGLVEATIILRRHTDAIKKFNDTWWYEIKHGSRRDQISFNYVAKKLGIKYKFFPGHLRTNNYLFVRKNHSK